MNFSLYREEIRLMETTTPPIIKLLGNVVLRPCLPLDVVLKPCRPLVAAPPPEPELPPLVVAPPPEPELSPVAPYIQIAPLPVAPSCLLDEVDMILQTKPKKQNKLLKSWFINVGAVEPPLVDYLTTNAVPVSLEQRVAFVRYLVTDNFNNTFDELYALMPPRLTRFDKQRISVEAAVNAWVMATKTQADSFMNVTVQLPHADVTMHATDSAMFAVNEQVAAFNEELKALGLKAPLAPLKGGARQDEHQKLLTAAQNAFGAWLRLPVDVPTSEELVKQKVPVSLQSQNRELPLSYQVRQLLYLVVQEVLMHASVVHPVTLRNRNLKTLPFNELTDLQLLLYATGRTLLPLPPQMEEQVFEEIEKVINFETIESSKEVLEDMTKKQKDRRFLHLFFGYLQLSGPLRAVHSRFKLSPTYTNSWKAFRQFFDQYTSNKTEDTKSHETVRDAFNHFTRLSEPTVYGFDQFEQTNFIEISDLYQNIIAGMQNKTLTPEQTFQLNELNKVYSLLQEHKDAPLNEIIEAAKKPTNFIAPDTLYRVLPNLGLHVRMDTVWDDILLNLYLGKLYGPERVQAVNGDQMINLKEVKRKYRKLALNMHPDKFPEDAKQFQVLSEVIGLFETHENKTASEIVDAAVDANIPTAALLKFMPLLDVNVVLRRTEDIQKKNKIVPIYAKELFEDVLGLGYNRTSNDFFTLKTPQYKNVQYAVNILEHYRSDAKELNLEKRNALKALISSLETYETQLQQTQNSMEFINLVFTPRPRMPQSAEMNVAKGEFLQFMQEQHGDDDELQSTLNRARGVTGPPMSPNLPFYSTREMLFKVLQHSYNMSFPEDEPTMGCPVTKLTGFMKRVLPFNVFDASNTEGSAATGSTAPYTPEFVENLVKLNIFKNTQEAYARLNETLIPDENSVIQTVVDNTIIRNFPVRYVVQHKSGVVDRGIATPFDFQSLPPYVTDWVPPSVPQDIVTGVTDTSEDVFFPSAVKDVAAVHVKPGYTQSRFMPARPPQTTEAADFTAQTVAQADTAQVLATAARFTIQNTSAFPALNSAYEAAAFNTTALAQATLDTVTRVDAHVAPHAYSFNAVAEHALNVSKMVPPAVQIDTESDARSMLAYVTLVVANTTVQALANAEHLNRQVLTGNAAETVRSSHVLENLLVTVISNVESGNAVAPVVGVNERAGAAQMNATIQKVLTPVLADTIVALAGVQDAVAERTLQNLTNLSSRLDAVVAASSAGLPTGAKISFKSIITAVNDMHANDTSTKLVVKQLLNVSRGALQPHVLTETVRVMTNTRTVNKLKTLVLKSAQNAKSASDAGALLQNTTLPAFVDAVQTDPLSTTAQTAAFRVYTQALTLRTTLRKTVTPLQTFNQTIASFLGAAVERGSARGGEPTSNASGVVLAQAAGAVTEMTVGNNSIYTAMRANESFMTGKHENRHALLATTRAQTNMLNNQLELSLNQTLSALEPLMQSAQTIMYGRQALNTPAVQQFVDNQTVANVTMLRILPTNATLDLFFGNVSDAIATTVVDSALTPNQMLYALGKMFSAVTPAVTPAELKVVPKLALARDVCTMAEKEIDQCFPTDQPVEEQVARLLAGVATKVVASTQQVVQGSSTLAQKLAVETKAMVDAERVFLEQAYASLRQTLDAASAEVQEDVRETLLVATKKYLQPAMAHVVKHGQRTMKDVDTQVNVLVRALPVLQTVVQLRAVQLKQEASNAIKEAYALALRAGSATLQSAQEQIGVASAAGGKFVTDASVTLHAVGVELAKTGMKRMNAFTSYSAEQVSRAAGVAQLALQDGMQQLQSKVEELRDFVDKYDAEHNQYLRQEQQQNGVGMLLYDTVVQPGVASAYTTRMYQNITSVAAVAAPAQTSGEQALVRSYWSSVFDLQRGGTAMFSQNDFVNFTRDNAASLLYTPLLPTSTWNDPGISNAFSPMVPYTGLFQDASGKIEGTVVYVPIFNSHVTIPVFLRQHAVKVSVPDAVSKQVATAMTQLGSQAAVPQLTAVKIMQQSRNIDTFISIIVSLLPADATGELILPEDAGLFVVTEVPETVDVQSTMESLQEMSAVQLQTLLQGLEQYKQRLTQVEAIHDRGVMLTSGVFYPEAKLFPHEVYEQQVTTSFAVLHEAVTTYVQLNPGTTPPVDLNAVQADVTAARAVLQASRVTPQSTLDLVAASAHTALTRQLVQVEEKLNVLAAVLAASEAPVKVAVQVAPAPFTQQQYALQQLLMQNTKFQLAMRQVLTSQVATAVETVNVLQQTREDLPLQQSVKTTNTLLDAWVKNNETMSVKLMSEMADKQVQLESTFKEIAPSVAPFAHTTVQGRTYFEPSNTIINEKIETVLQQSFVQKTFMGTFAAPAIALGSATTAMCIPFLVGPAAAAYVSSTNYLQGLKFVQTLLGLAGNVDTSNSQIIAQFMQTAEYMFKNAPDEFTEFIMNSEGQSYVSNEGEFILRNAQKHGAEGVAAIVPLWKSILRKIVNAAPEERLGTLTKFPAGLLGSVRRFGGVQTVQRKLATAILKNKAAFIVGGAQIVTAIAVLETLQTMTGKRVGLTGMLEIAGELVDVGRVVKDELPLLTKNREDLKSTLLQATTRTLMDEATQQPWHPVQQMRFVAGLNVAIADIEQQMVSALKVQQTGPLTAAPLAAFGAEVQTLVDNVSILMTAIVKKPLRGAVVRSREDMRQDVNGVMTYLKRFTAFLANVPDNEKGFGMDEVLRFAQTHVSAAAFQPNLDDVRKLAAGDRSTYVQSRDSALEAIVAIRARVTAQYETQTGRSVASAAPTGINSVFQHPVDKETYTVLQDLQRLQTSLSEITL